MKHTGALGGKIHPRLMEDIFFLFHPRHSSQVPRVPSHPFLWSESKADTLNAMNDIDLNLWGGKGNFDGCVCVSGTERRSGGLWRRGRWSLRSSGGTKRGRELQERSPLQCAQRIVKWLCYREQVNCVSPPRLLYFPLYYDLQGYSFPLPPRHNLCCSFEGSLLIAIVPGQLWSA